MHEKSNFLQAICKVIGLLAFLIYFILYTVGTSSIWLVIRITVIAIGLTAFAIECGAEIASNKKFGLTIFYMSLCAMNFIANAIRLI